MKVLVAALLAVLFILPSSFGVRVRVFGSKRFLKEAEYTEKDKADSRLMMDFFDCVYVKENKSYAMQGFGSVWYYCSLCDDSVYRSVSLLWQHIEKNHQSTGKKYFLCPYKNCDFCIANTIKKIQTHLEKKHKNRGEPCAFCLESFGRRDTYFRHLKRVHKVPVWLCGKCWTPFKQYKLLKKHTC